MKKIMKVINHMITFLLFGLLITTAIMVISFRASGGEADILGYQFKTVLSGSMEPEIQTGSIIAIKQGGEMTRFEKGDIITFRTQEDILITHRVDEVIAQGKQYITKGDSNDGVDATPVLAENIVGTYTGFTIPYIGYAMNFANTEQGAALVLILPGIILVIYSAVSIWQALRKLDNLKNMEKIKTNSREIR